MREQLNFDGGSGVANSCLLKQMLQENARMFGLSFRRHNTNEYVWQEVNILAGRQELLLSQVIMVRRGLSAYHDIRC